MKSQFKAALAESRVAHFAIGLLFAWGMDTSLRAIRALAGPPLRWIVTALAIYDLPLWHAYLTMQMREGLIWMAYTLAYFGLACLVSYQVLAVGPITALRNLKASNWRNHDVQ